MVWKLVGERKKFNREAALSAKRGDNIASIVVDTVQKGTDLDHLVQQANKFTPEGWRGSSYTFKVVDEVLEHYNNFKFHNAFHEDKKLNKLYSRQKAVWLGYRRIAKDNDFDVSLWTFNPFQIKLL